MEHQAWLDKPDLLAVSGSRLYGMETESSDWDYRGFVLPPLEYIIGLNRFEQHQPKDTDLVLYSLRKLWLCW